MTLLLSRGCERVDGLTHAPAPETRRGSGARASVRSRLREEKQRALSLLLSMQPQAESTPTVSKSKTPRAISLGTADSALQSGGGGIRTHEPPYDGQRFSREWPRPRNMPLVLDLLVSRRPRAIESAIVIDVGSQQKMRPRPWHGDYHCGFVSRSHRPDSANETKSPAYRPHKAGSVGLNDRFARKLATAGRRWSHRGPLGG